MTTANAKFPSKINLAGVAELADAQDLKSWVAQAACGFDSRPRHQMRHAEMLTNATTSRFIRRVYLQVELALQALG